MFDKKYIIVYNNLVSKNIKGVVKVNIFDLISNEINSNIKELSKNEYLELKENKKIKYETHFIEESILCKIDNNDNFINAGESDEINCLLDIDIKYFSHGVFKYMNRYILTI